MPRRSLSKMNPSVILSAAVFLLSSISFLKCETLRNILMEKYSRQLNPGIYVGTRIENEEIVQINIPAPLTPERRVLTNRNYLELIENFESDPAGVYTNENLRTFVVTRPVKDYDTDPLSRKLIHHCLEICTDHEYVKMLIIAAVQHNVASLISKLSLSRDVCLVELSSDPLIRERSFTSTVVRSGNFHIAKDFFRLSIVMDKPEVWIETILRNLSWNSIDSTTDFLKFLIVEMNLFDINSKQGGQTILHSVLRFPVFNDAGYDLKAYVAQYLVHLGADPTIPDGFGLSPFNLAALQEIHLEV